MEMNQIVADDGKATPVPHTFSVQEGQTTKAGFATWYERIAGKASAFWPSLRARAALSSGPKQDHVVQLQLVIPVTAMVNGVDTVTGTRRLYVTSLAPYNGNAEEQLESDFGLLKNVLANAQVKNLFVKTQPAH